MARQAGSVGAAMVSPPVAGGGLAGTGTNQVGAGGRRAEVRGSSEGTAAVAGPRVVGPVMGWLVRREPVVRRAAMPRPAIRQRGRAVCSGPRRVTAVLAVPALAVARVAVLDGVVTGAAMAQIAVAVIAVAGPRIPGPCVARPSIA